MSGTLMGGEIVAAIPPRHCFECPFKRIEADEAAELFGDYPFGDPDRPMLCHFDGEFNGLRRHLCKGFYAQAQRRGYDTGCHVDRAATASRNERGQRADTR